MVLDKTKNTNKIIVTHEGNYINYSIKLYNDFTKESALITLTNLSLNNRYYEFNISHSDIENVAIGKLNYSLLGEDVLIKNGVVTIKGLAPVVQTLNTVQPQFKTLRNE